MQFDFSGTRFRRTAFSEKPMVFIDQEPKTTLGAIIDLAAIETGNRDARDYWVQTQLENLLQHAVSRSAFWRKRVGVKKIKGVALSDLPVLTRSDVARQVESEGSLLPPSGPIGIAKHATSGSSGKPVRFFTSEMNQQYTAVRALAQYFFEGRDLTLNRTSFRPIYEQMENGFLTEKSPGWLGSLNALFISGSNKHISYLRPNRDMLFKELAKDPIGHLIVQPRLLESLFFDRDISFLADHGTKMFIPIAERLEK